MSDVFISYRREDKASAHRLVRALKGANIDVWWDDDIPPEAPWEATIEAALEKARVVIVCWSKEAVQSENVKGEARRARERGKLIQIFVEECEPPLFFGERQGVDLADWSGSEKDPRFLTVLEAVKAIREGKPPPKGVGYVAKRLSKWPAIFLVPLALMAIPVALDWMLAVRVAVLLGISWAIWKHSRIVVASALSAGLLINVALDLVRYRFASPSYYAVECSLGDPQCLGARSYRFGDRLIRLYPLAGGALHRMYAGLVAGGDRFGRSHLQREKVSGGEAFLSPAEVQLLRYLDGGAASREVSITFQPLSRRFNPEYPWSRVLISIGTSHSPRPDVLGELNFAAGMTSTGQDTDVFDPEFLRALGTAAPSYSARRSSALSYGFQTPIDVRDEPVLWKRAVINDQLFQLYASDNLDQVLIELAAEYPSLPDLDRLLYDALRLSYWCGQNRNSSGIIACTTGAAKLANDVSQQELLGTGNPAKIAIVKQILRLVVSLHFAGIPPDQLPFWATGLSLDPYSTALEVDEILRIELLKRYPELKEYLRGAVSAAASNRPLINPTAASDVEFDEYLGGLTNIGRTDALQALLPLRRALAEGYLVSVDSGPDIFAWGRAISSDLAGIASEGKISASHVPSVYGLIKRGLGAAETRSRIFERYQRVDDALDKIGGPAPLAVSRSRSAIAQTRIREKAVNESFDELVQLLDKGSTLAELTAVADREGFAQVMVPEGLEVAAQYLGAVSALMEDLEIEGGAQCTAALSRRLALIKSTSEKNGAARLISQLKDLLLESESQAVEAASLQEAISSDCADLFAEFSSTSRALDWAYRYTTENPILRSPQTYLAGDPQKDGLISSRQYMLATVLELVAKAAASAEWLGAEDDRVSGWNTRNGLVQGALEGQDYEGLRASLCGQWREPIWVYSELQNESVGWRRLPLFFSVLAISAECEGAPTARVREYLDNLLGAGVVDVYLAVQAAGDSRVHVAGVIDATARSEIAKAPEWSMADVATSARLALYDDVYKQYEPYRPRARIARNSQSSLCGEDPCDPAQQRLFLTAFNSYRQSVSSPSDLMDPNQEQHLFLAAPQLPLDEDIEEDLMAFALLPLPDALADIRGRTTNEAFKPLFGHLLRQPTEAQFKSIQSIASAAALSPDEANRFWIAASRVFSRTEPLLALSALERVTVEGLQADAISIRKTALMVRGGKQEEAGRLALELLQQNVAGSDVERIRFALENALQTFYAARDCLACRQSLAPPIFEGFARLDALYGSVRDDRSEREYFARVCLSSKDPLLIAVADEAADRALAPLIAKNSSAAGKDNQTPASAMIDPQFLTEDLATSVALSTKENLAAFAPDRVRPEPAVTVLKTLSENAVLRPSASVLTLVEQLVFAAGGDGRKFAEIWIDRSASSLKEALSSPDPLPSSFDQEFLALARLADEDDSRLASLIDALVARALRDYSKGDYRRLSPLELIRTLDLAVEPAKWKPGWRMPNSVVARYIEHGDFTVVVDSCSEDAFRCRAELSGLLRHLASSAQPGEILKPSTRQLAVELARVGVSEDAATLPGVAANLSRELNEPQTILAADLLANKGLSRSAGRGDFEGLARAIAFIGMAINESALATPAPTPPDRIGRFNQRIVELLLEDYLPDEIQLGCCRSTEASRLFLELLIYRMSRPDACAWLEASDVQADVFLRQKGKDQPNLETRSPLLAKMLKGENACAGQTNSDRIAALDARIASNPDDAASLYTRGLSHFALKAHETAFADLDSAAIAAPDKGRYENSRCWYRAVAGKQLEIAREACARALSLEPQNADFFDSRGLVGIKQDRFQDAWNDYNAAVLLDSNDASARFGRGIAALRLNREDEGHADLAAAAKLDPGIRLIYRDRGIAIRENKGQSTAKPPASP